MRKYYLIGAGTLVVTALFYFFVMGIVGRQSLSVDTSVWGAFGAYFGGISGPILSFLAFIILAKTLIIQQSMSKEQKLEQSRQRQLSELELSYKNLERLEKQVDEKLGASAKSLGGKSIKEVLSEPKGEIDKDSPSVQELAKVTLRTLMFISYYVGDIERRLKEYHPQDSEFASLSFKQYWILKYTPLATACLFVTGGGDLTIPQRKCLLDGLGV